MHHVIKAGRRHGSKTHCIPDLSSGWRWELNFVIWSLYPEERAPGTHWIGCWVGCKVDLNMVLKREIPAFSRNPGLELCCFFVKIIAVSIAATDLIFH
jgi:hypothetical protein